MVNSLELFRKHFESYVGQYVLIGGTACTVIMQKSGLDFRATKDLDIVLYVKALQENFVKAFWQFVDDGGYKNKQHSTSKEVFYRFSSPNSHEYPAMLELFSRVPDNVKLSRQGHLTPIPVDESVASLSAILLDADYYHFIHAGKLIINGLSILSAAHLIPIKARAYIDLTIRKNKGESIDDRDIRKHKNDIIRLFQLLSPVTRVSLPSTIRKDLQTFLENMKVDFSFDGKSLGLKGMNANKIIGTLEEIYLLNI